MNTGANPNLMPPPAPGGDLIAWMRETVDAHLSEPLSVETDEDFRALTWGELEALGMDSLDQVSLIVECENFHNIDFMNQEERALKNIGDLVDATRAKISANA